MLFSRISANSFRSLLTRLARNTPPRSANSTSNINLSQSEQFFSTSPNVTAKKMANSEQTKISKANESDESAMSFVMRDHSSAYKQQTFDYVRFHVVVLVFCFSSFCFPLSLVLRRFLCSTSRLLATTRRTLRLDSNHRYQSINPSIANNNERCHQITRLFPNLRSTSF